MEYLIDAQNRRVGKKLNGVMQARWLYSSQLAPMAELDSIGAVRARYIYATHVNIPDYVVTDTATYRVVTDHLGSLRLIVNQSTGSVVRRVGYDAWGNVLEDTNPGFTPFGYAGGMFEQQTKLVRFGVRDYDCVTGRWVSKDPIVFWGDGANLFGYAKTDPINAIDVYGLQRRLFCRLRKDLKPEESAKDAVSSLFKESLIESGVPSFLEILLRIPTSPSDVVLQYLTGEWNGQMGPAKLDMQYPPYRNYDWPRANTPPGTSDATRVRLVIPPMFVDYTTGYQYVTGGRRQYDKNGGGN
jgi:RHS repeat-associated protein